MLVCTNLALFINDGVQNNGNVIHSLVVHVLQGAVKYFYINFIMYPACFQKCKNMSVFIFLNHATQRHELSVHLKRIQVLTPLQAHVYGCRKVY